MAKKKPIPDVPTGRVEKALRSWRNYLKHSSRLTEAELVKLIEFEEATKRRKMILVRAYMRLRKVRGIKERNRMEKNF